MIKDLVKATVTHIRDNIKYTNICIIGIREGGERGKGTENI